MIPTDVTLYAERQAGRTMDKYNVLRAMTRDGAARVTVINSKNIIDKMVEYHHPAPTSVAAFGRVLTAASMIGSMMKDKEDTITLRITGDGQVEAIIACSDYCGNVRGYMMNPDADLPVRSDGKLDVRGIIGKGQLTITREFNGGAPQTGTVELISGEIAEDVCNYFAQSEQTPTECSLGVLVNPDGTCKAAGGILIQLLPYADPKTVDRLESNAKNITNISRLFDSGMTNSDILARALEGIEYDEFDEFTSEYKCRCSKERFLGAISSFSEKELNDLFDENNNIETNCKFCGKKYIFSKSEIMEKRKKDNK